MSQDEFTKLFTYMQKEFAEVNARLDELKTEFKGDIDGIYTKLDDIAASIDEEDTERAAMIAQLDRHDRWHHEVADHIGLTLQHDA